MRCTDTDSRQSGISDVMNNFSPFRLVEECIATCNISRKMIEPQFYLCRFRLYIETKFKSLKVSHDRKFASKHPQNYKDTIIFLRNAWGIYLKFFVVGETLIRGGVN